MAKPSDIEDRNLGSRHLDIEVATRVMDYRWVEWDHAALLGGPLDEPGRFLARPDQITSHLHVLADRTAPLNRSPLRYVPRYSRAADEALIAADAAGVFTAGAGTLSRDGDRWVVLLRVTGDRFADDEVAAVLCRAAVHMASRAQMESQ